MNEIIGIELVPEQWQATVVLAVAALGALLAFAEAFLRFGEQLAKRTQPTWDDQAVARGLRVVNVLKTGFRLLKRKRAEGAR